MGVLDGAIQINGESLDAFRFALLPVAMSAVKGKTNKNALLLRTFVKTIQ